MIVLHSLDQLSSLKAPLHLALGTFDGVHLGHQTLISCAKKAAEKDPSSLCAVLSFSNPPRAYFRKEEQPQLCSLEEKKALLEALGVDLLLSLPFNEEMAQLSAEEFLEKLLEANPYGIKSLSVGSDWHFGKNRQGNVAWLKAHQTQFPFSLFVPEDVLCPKGERVSSTRLRHALQKGDLPLTNTLLGHPYRLQGHVLHGQALARSLGAPTANIELPSPLPLLPPLGVYVGQVSFLSSEGLPLGVWGVANLGKRPSLTHPDPEPTLEVHLLDFEGDLYGQVLSFHFLHFLRPEQKFASLDLLKAQIALDIQKAKEYRDLVTNTL